MNNNDNLSRDLFVFEDENNKKSTQKYGVWSSTVLDQVFDQLSPTRKNLRQILEELKQEILTGGSTGIVFPVTTVNGRDGDVILTANDFGLGRVDNTRDIDKPLSTPQRSAVMDILSMYDFNINLDDLYGHVSNFNNPHKVTLDHINVDDTLSRFIDGRIMYHNSSTDSGVHMDIRRLLSTLWNRIDNIDDGLDERIDDVLGIMTIHLDEPLAHYELFQEKENIVNKSMGFDQSNNNHSSYPTTRAVVEFITNRLSSFKETIPDIQKWISDIKVIQRESDLPIADLYSLNMGYIIAHGAGEHRITNSLAICRKDVSGEYYWDISDMHSVSKFDPVFFIETENGLSLNLAAILASNLEIDQLFTDITGTDIPDGETIYDIFLRSIKILPGTMDGRIRYYVNNDPTTLSEEIAIPGLQSLAYKEFITENDIIANSIHNVHLLNRSVDNRVIKEKSITADKLADELYHCEKGRILGNISDSDNRIQEIDYVQLADILRPILGGWPDSSVPGWNPIINEMSPHLWEPGIEQTFTDKVSFGMRFKGTISVRPNQQINTILSTLLTSDKYQLLDAGGSWRTDTEIDADCTLGGSNITGHRFASITMTKNKLELGTISIGDRVDAPYDVWIKYMKR